jgi:hypothetical protein
MKSDLLKLLLPFITFAALPGCGSARDVAVSGTVAEAASTNPSGPIRIEFYESADSSDAAPAAPVLKLVDSISLPAAGAFDATVSTQGKQLYVIGIVDADGSSGCTDGESWGETIVPIAADDTAKVTVNIAPQSHCLPMSTTE